MPFHVHIVYNGGDRVTNSQPVTKEIVGFGLFNLYASDIVHKILGGEFKSIKVQLLNSETEAVIKEITVSGKV